MKLDNVKYKVIEDMRIVIATIKGIKSDAVRTFNNRFLAHSTSDIEINCWDNQRFMMPYSMKAVARCSPEDEFDVEKGKKIALKKLSEKYNRSLDKHLLNIFLEFVGCLDNMDEYFQKRFNV